MKKRSINVIKLGVFVLTGLALVILMLYLLGKNSSIFSKRFELSAHFRDINGLLVGNNVRFSGIDVGIVRRIEIMNDTVIAVTMNLDKEMKRYIRTNSVASLGTDGLIGNRVVNITPVGGAAPFVQGGELLPSHEEVNTQAMLQTLYRTNENIAGIAEEIRSTVHSIQTSQLLVSLLNDETLSANLRISLQNLQKTTENANILSKDAIETLQLASKGKGTLATLLTDTTLMIEVNKAVQQIKTLETTAGKLVKDVNVMVNSVEKDINQGDGSVNMLLRDSLTAARLRATIDNAEKGTAAFAQDMEALKSNFLFRRYFKNQEKKAAKAAKPKHD
jgi:phospholipid/cholesterol/gamma-HCH transport system substrate-binding protein